MRSSTSKQTRFFLVAGFLSAGLAGALRAEPAAKLPPSFTLGRYIPGDCWMFIHHAANPESAWIDDHWSRVWTALKDSGIDRDLTALVFSLLDDQQRTEVESTLEKATELLAGVRWGEICGGPEFVFAERVTTEMPGYDYMALARGTPESAAANFNGLVAIFKELSGRIPAIRLRERTSDGVPMWSMAFGGRPEMGQSDAFVVTLFHKGDVLGLVTGSHTLKQVLARVNGKSDAGSIIASPRFQKALAEVPSPEDDLLFFDVGMLLNQLPAMIKSAVVDKMAGAGAAGAKDGATKKKDEGNDADAGNKVLPKELGLIDHIVRLCDIVDYSVTSVETKDRQQFTHTVTRLQAGKEDSPVAKLFCGRKPFERFDQYIPENAKGFDLTGFLDLEGTYNLILDFVRHEVPNGAELITKWQGILASVDFDPQRDVFSWWSGEMISITLPAVVATPMSQEDSVLMIRTKDKEVAAAKVNGAIDHLAAMVRNHGQMLLVQPVTVRGSQFREVTHPMAAMYFRPVIGMSGDWLMVSSSTAAINKCLDVAAGEAPSIMKNERFLKEGLRPKGPVASASFTDTSRYGEELGQAVAMAGTIGGMMPMFMAGAANNNEEAKKVMTFMQKLFSIVGKLGPVLQKIDFYSSEASMTVDDGPISKTTMVVTYKDAKELSESRSASIAPSGK